MLNFISNQKNVDGESFNPIIIYANILDKIYCSYTKNDGFFNRAG